MPKILLVEDDTNLREIFDMRLKAEGYQTVAASDGEEGLVVAMKERPDLIIADVMMPKLSGFEMLETLFAAPEMSGTKAIMMTALGQPEDRARGEKLGVVKYLVKSQVTLEDFVRVVKEVMSPDQPATGSTNPSSQTTNQESEAPMQDDSNPQAAPAQPADDSATNANPVTGSADAGQTSADEQSAVQDQINSFVNTPAPGQTVSPDASAQGPADSGMAAPSEPTASTDVNSGPDVPMSTPPAEQPAQPPADQAAPDGGAQPPADGTL